MTQKLSLSFIEHPSEKSAVIEQWKQLWHTSSEATVYNSPEWFFSHVHARKEETSILFTAYDCSQLVAVIPLTGATAFAVRVLSFPGSSFLHSSSLLYQPGSLYAVCQLISYTSRRYSLLLHHLNRHEHLALQADKNIPYTVTGEINNPSVHILLTSNPVLPKTSQILKKARPVIGSMRLDVHTSSLQKMLDVVFTIDEQSTKKAHTYNVFENASAKHFFRELAENLSQYMHIAILYLDNRPVAYEIGFLHQGIYHDCERAIVSGTEEYTPGKVLMVRLIEYLAAHNVTTVDLGPGVDNFKKSIAQDMVLTFDGISTHNPILRAYYIAVSYLRHHVYTFIFQHKKIYSVYRYIKLFIVRR